MIEVWKLTEYTGRITYVEVDREHNYAHHDGHGLLIEEWDRWLARYTARYLRTGNLSHSLYDGIERLE